MSTAKELGERIKAWVNPHGRVEYGENWRQVCAHVDALVSLAQPGEGALTDEQIDNIARALPGGVEGYCKTWGYVTLARAIEAAHGITSTPTGDSNG